MIYKTSWGKGAASKGRWKWKQAIRSFAHRNIKIYFNSSTPKCIWTQTHLIAVTIALNGKSKNRHLTSKLNGLSKNLHLKHEFKVYLKVQQNK